jgi:hypothetical protein
MKTIEVPLDPPLNRRFPGSPASDNPIKAWVYQGLAYQDLGRMMRLTFGQPHHYPKEEP